LGRWLSIGSKNRAIKPFFVADFPDLPEIHIEPKLYKGSQSTGIAKQTSPDAGTCPRIVWIADIAPFLSHYINGFSFNALVRKTQNCPALVIREGAEICLAFYLLTTDKY